MAYAKQQKICQDMPVGLTRVTQMRDNLEALQSAFALEHGVSPTPQPFLRQQGRHNTPLVPRTVCVITAQTLSYSIIMPATTPLGDAISGVSRLNTGVYFITTRELVKVWGRSTPTYLSGHFRQSNVVSVYPTASVGSPYLGLAVELLQDGIPTDYDFSLCVYGTTA